MKLIALKLRNFRAYKEETLIEFDNLTAFIGKNDVGKSSIFEALEVFFNNKSPKLDNDDLNIYASENDKFIEISCVFSDFPPKLIIDTAAETSLESEYLINEHNYLEIKKVFNCGLKNPSEKTYIIAQHPTNETCNNLLSLKITELKNLADRLEIERNSYNRLVSSEIRKAIWNECAPLTKGTSEIQIDEEGMKKIWKQIESWLPQFALFKSDRESSDGDKEVTDPMKVAINNALSEIEDKLREVQERVRDKVVEVANNTLDKLREINPELANQLEPNFKSEPKWANIFSLTLTSDDDIPINKRGSGVRRLIILNFFRAEAERRRNERNSKSILYAFEEPENSQHPDHQKKLINAFAELSEADNTQVFLTTHNPTLAGLIQENSLRLISKTESGEIQVFSDIDDDILKVVSKTLGVLPDPTKPKLLICVEGHSDIMFIRRLNAIIRQETPNIINVNDASVVAFIPLGGGNLKEWVNSNHLKEFYLPEFHIYDKDDETPPKYEAARDEVRNRNNGSWAVLTNKREIENYIHSSCLKEVFGFDIDNDDNDDIPLRIAKLIHEASDSTNPWDELNEYKKKKKISRVKKRIYDETLNFMDYEKLREIDPQGEVEGWFDRMKECIELGT